MYNSSKGNNSGSFSGSKPTDSPNGPSSKFQNKNLNSSLKAPAAATTYSKPGVAVIRGSKGVGKSIGGAAAPTATLAPVPLNTPSIKRENNGHDPNVNIVQSHGSGGVWGHGSSSGGGAEISPAERPSTQPVSSLSKPAPWAKSASTASAGESTPTANPDSSATKPASVSRPQTSNWADVDIDSDEDDAPRAPVSRVLGAVQAAASRPAEPQTGFGYNNAFNPNSNDYRKDRSGSFNNDNDRRFGGFGGNSGYSGQDDRFANRGGLTSGDARFNSQQSPGDFGGRNNFNNGPYNNNGFGQAPGMRSNNNNFPPRSGPVGGFGSFPNSNANHFPPQGQRPPVGDFSRPGGYGVPQAQGHFANMNSNSIVGGGASRLDPEQQRIEEARNEAQELEAKRLRKRTMSEDYTPPGGNANTPAGGAAGAGASGATATSVMPPHQTQNSSLSSFGMPASADQRDGGFQGRRDFNNQGYNAGQAPGHGPPDSRWGGRDYNNHNNNNFGGNNFFQNHGNEGHHSGGYGSSGGDFQQRAPYRTRGPSFDNSGPDGGLRSFGHGSGHGGPSHHQFPNEQYSEPMWERVKVPPPVPQPQRVQQQPYGAEPSDRWAARQGLPPPPMLHYASNPPNAAPAGLTMMPPGYRPERERGPRSGNTPREGEADRATAPRTAAPAPASSASPSLSAQSQYDPSKPFSSLFGGKSAAEAAQQGQGQAQDYHGTLSQLDYPLPHEEAARGHRGNLPASSEQPRPASYEQEQRLVYPSAAGPVGGPRPKVLYDPQSNEYRPLERDTPKASYSAKAPEKKNPRAAGPPASASEDAVDEKASARKSLQVNRIEQNTEQKWARAKEAAPAVIAETTTARPARHTIASEGHDDTEAHEQSREAYLAERKAMRQKERDERGPRTRGFLFKFNAEGAIERVLTAAELEAKQRKLDRTANANKNAKRIDAVEPSYDHLDFDHLTKEEFQALPKAKKDEIRAKHQAEKAARRAEPREARQDARRSQYPSEYTEDLTVENLSIVGHKVPVSAVNSGPCDHGDLDIQQTAWEIDAHRSQQPIKAFVPGQGYGHAVPSVPLPHELPMQNWREGAQVIPAARHEQESHLHHQQQPQPYQTIVQPHTYQPIIHQPILNHAPAHQAWNYSSYAGVSEPALYGGNTSFLGQQESTVGQIFSALQSLRPENDQEITESYEAREARDHHKGAGGNGAIARGERPAVRGDRAEEHTEAREYTGRGGGRGSNGGRGKTDKFERFERPRRSDEDQDARATSDARESRGGRGKSGRGAGRGPPSEHDSTEGSARPASAYGGRGGRGEGRGEGRGGRGGRGGRDYKPRAGPPSEPVSA